VSLDVKRLELARELAGGIFQARCPACAEDGGDRKGEHLRIYPDGRFGCCVHPKDREHRRRIHALVGERTPRLIEVRVAAPNQGGEVVRGILGRLGRVFGSPIEERNSKGVSPGRLGRGTAGPTEAPGSTGGSDAADGVPQVQLRPVELPRTLRTGVSDSNPSAVDTADNSRTLRTPLNPYRDGELFFRDKEEEYRNKYKEFSPPVRSVRGQGHEMDFAEGVRGVRGQGVGMGAAEGVRAVRDQVQVAALQRPRAAGERCKLPFLTADGTLSIPFDSPERYHWWKPGGQRLHVNEILAEIRVREQEVANGATY
jgi:hypothetical protein